MFIRELLVERVSVIGNTNEMRKHVAGIIDNTATMLYKKHHAMVETDSKQIIQLLYGEIKPLLEEYLETAVSPYAHKTVNVEFTILDRGTGKYSSEDSKLYISQKVLVDLCNLKGSIKTKEITGYKKESIPAFVGMYNNTIDTLLTIVLHEMTHGGQQKSDKHDEYRKSYLEPNIIKFLTQLLDDEIDDTIKMKLDLSQPQEIAAYANQAAVEVTHHLHKMEPNKQKQAISLLLKDIQHKRENRNIPRVLSTYAGIAKDGKRAEQMYRRFLKLFYQELNTYSESL